MNKPLHDEQSFPFIEVEANRICLHIINYKKNLIINFICSNHLIGDISLFLDLQSRREVMLPTNNFKYLVENEGSIKMNQGWLYRYRKLSRVPGSIVWYGTVLF